MKLGLGKVKVLTQVLIPVWSRAHLKQDNMIPLHPAVSRGSVIPHCWVMVGEQGWRKNVLHLKKEKFSFTENEKFPLMKCMQKSGIYT